NRHQRERTDPRASLGFLPIPADRQREKISDDERAKMGQDFEPVGTEQFQHQPLTAFSTSAACPGTLTLRQARMTFPSSPMRKVDRSIPIYFRPYIDFSTHV